LKISGVAITAKTAKKCGSPPSTVGCSFRAQMISTGIDLPLPERLAQFRLPTSIKAAVLPVNLFTGDFRPCLNPSPLPPIAVCGTAGGSEVLSRMVFVQACAGCPKVYG
jgi:hypothetical protein